jgi:hypothetical protein
MFEILYMLRVDETDPDMASSYESTEKAVADSRQGVSLQLGG